MRTAAVVISIFLTSFLCIITVLTIGSYTLQKDEIEKALDFALVQTMRTCAEEQIVNPDTIANKAKDNFDSQINSKRGSLKLYVLYADENVIDLAVEFSYTQYNGTKKKISCRETIIKDWSVDSPAEYTIRGISKKYLNEAPERGGLTENSVWKQSSEYKTLLQNIFANTKVGSEWNLSQNLFTIK